VSTEAIGDIRESSLYNEDLAPVPQSRRDWGVYNYASLWVGMSVCIPTYMLASGLIAGGMNWWQAVGTILLGNLVVLVPMLLNAHAGTKYGIPFPVLVRAPFGVLGANVPALLRALVACGWFGIQTWIGGQAINAMLRILWPAWGGFGGGSAARLPQPARTAAQASRAAHREFGLRNIRISNRNFRQARARKLNLTLARALIHSARN